MYDNNVEPCSVVESIVFLSSVKNRGVYTRKQNKKNVINMRTVTNVP